jgi:hypothetical protein
MPPLPAPVVDATLWRDLRPPKQRLSIGILLNNWQVPDWIFQAVKLLESEPTLDLAALLIHGEPLPDSRNQPFLFHLLCIASLKKANAGDPVHDLSREFSFTPQAKLSEAPPIDILIRFDTAPLQGPSAGLAKFGVWSIGLGDSPDFPYFAEVRDQKPVSVLALRHHPESLAEAHPFYEYAAPTRQGWLFTANALEPCQLAGVFLVDRLLEVAANGYESVVGRLNPINRKIGTIVLQPKPANLACSGFVARQAVRSIAGRLRSRDRSLRWVSAIRSKSNGVFREIPAPPGHGYADPFLLEWEGRDYLLIEDVPPHGRGRVAAMCVSSDGIMGPPQMILEKPYHLSYPFVFHHGADLFLIPESANNKTVELYRASRAPFEWQFEKNLFEGPMLVDTTVFHHEGLWYFFTTQVDHGMRAYLFYADAPDGEWKYHPRNPICSDVSRSRGAGALFYRGGRLIRPAQDCSVRYGYAIVLNEVRKLSPTEYEDAPVERLERCWWGPKGWRNVNLGTHTLNANARWEVTDGLRLMR